jgi:hypothetical protein
MTYLAFIIKESSVARLAIIDMATFHKAKGPGVVQDSVYL